MPTYLLALHVPGGHEEGHVPVGKVARQLLCPHQGSAGQEAPLQIAPAERGHMDGAGPVWARESGSLPPGAGVRSQVGKPAGSTVLSTPAHYRLSQLAPEKKG